MSQGEPSDPAAQWDRIFQTRELPQLDPGVSFMARSVDRLMREGRLEKGDSVLVLAMGDGRNALHLAELGLKVTGVDISQVALDKAQSTATQRGLEIEVVRADLFDDDLGSERWDLVTNIYFNPSVFIFDKLTAAVRPGGLLLIEGFASDYTGPGPPQQTRYRPNELPARLSTWRILDYEDGVFASAWALGYTGPLPQEW
jgi:SAM-dependent methyltransferase